MGSSVHQVTDLHRNVIGVPLESLVSFRDRLSELITSLSLDTDVHEYSPTRPFVATRAPRRTTGTSDGIAIGTSSVRGPRGGPETRSRQRRRYDYRSGGRRRQRLNRRETALPSSETAINGTTVSPGQPIASSADVETRRYRGRRGPASFGSRNRQLATSSSSHPSEALAVSENEESRVGAAGDNHSLPPNSLPHPQQNIQNNSGLQPLKYEKIDTPHLADPDKTVETVRNQVDLNAEMSLEQ
ncbi:unnamed protein product [Protopolystoma xenopodis]|uniref:Uncharacterized protein n=1 Tax=Protopolystoma xenopodis TaxID=117903 RepID=A0A448W9X3_9PLAT|nr:unnamed protein product [Protopolystoma xenopodis]